MRIVRIGLFGLGTVGSGVVRILQKHHDDFMRHDNVDIQLAACTAKTSEEAERLGIGDLYREADAIFDDPDIDIIIELIGGTGYALEVIERALRSGKHVVTANKAIMASHGRDIMALADNYKLNLAFEASVGGGIPIIGPLKHSLVGNEISSVLGIVNGTTNYMLTRMQEAGLSYNEALEEARAHGYAEADPTADVDGLDAAAKIAILASVAFNSRVTIDQVCAEGIRAIAPVDMANAESMGYTIKLLAIARRCPDGVDVRVHPTMIPKEHPLASVNGVYNAIYVTGDAVGETMFFGKGAGSGPAASAVMGDVIEVARYITNGIDPIVGCTCTDQLSVRPLSELVTQYYVRLSVVDRSGVLAATSEVFAKYKVSIYSVVQVGNDTGTFVDLVFVTHRTREADLRAALQEIAELDVVNEVSTVIHVEHEQVQY